MTDAPEPTPLSERIRPPNTATGTWSRIDHNILCIWADEVAALEQELASTEGALDAYAREVERLRAAIAQAGCDLELAQTHFTNATDELARALTKPEGE